VNGEIGRRSASFLRSLRLFAANSLGLRRGTTGSPPGRNLRVHGGGTRDREISAQFPRFPKSWYNPGMVRIRFSDQEGKRKALAYLAGRFAFKSWASGEMLVPESALAELAVEGIAFIVEGPATYEQRVPAVRNSPAAPV